MHRSTFRRSALPILLAASLALCSSCEKDCPEGTDKTEPVIHSVTPPCGGLDVETTVTIRGDGLYAKEGGVQVGGANVEVSGKDGALVCVVPARSEEGTVSVVYSRTLPEGCSPRTLSDSYDPGFTYVDTKAKVTKVSPAEGCDSGGDWVKISGSNLPDDVGFRFGGNDAPLVYPLPGPATISRDFYVLTPPGVAGATVDVRPVVELESCTITGSTDATFLYKQCDTQPMLYPRVELVTELAGPVLVETGDVLEGEPVDCVAVAGDGRVYVLRGDGAGGLSVDHDFAPGGEVSAVALADLDGDGWPELVVALPAGNQVAVYANDGGAGYSAVGVERYTAGGTPVSLAVVDLDLDGTLDVVTANQSSGDLVVLSGKGDGTLDEGASTALKVPTLAPLIPVADVSDVAALDHDGDGDDDLVVATGSNLSLELLRNDSSGGTLATAWVDSEIVLATAAGGAAIVGIAVGDFVGSADVAVLVSAPSSVSLVESKSGDDLDLRSTLGLSISDPVEVDVETVWLEPGDFTGNGTERDLAVGYLGGLLETLGHAGFGTHELLVRVTDGAGLYSMSAAYLDTTGSAAGMDLVLGGGADDGGLYVLRNTGSGFESAAP